jgi:hypothetical protein
VPFLKYAKEIAYAHQEKWDGSGYPLGISGDDIPISARLMAVADVYDALISRRVYKDGMSHEQAVQIMFEGRGTHLDSDIVDAFLELQEDFKKIAAKFADSDEANTSKAGYVRYFSRDTHTIYVPKIIMYWDNSAFTTGSLTAADTESYTIYTQVKPEYKDTEVAKIRIYARDKYPRKSPTNLFPIETVKYLPTTSYYAVFDAHTDEAIIPYDNIYNKVSCDSTSNYIYIDMNSFMPERYYRLEFKIVDGITEQYIDNDIYFKVVR